MIRGFAAVAAALLAAPTFADTIIFKSGEELDAVIVSHAHNDHYLGAKHLQDTYHARIIMSETDWDVMAKDTSAPELKPRMVSSR